MQYMGPTNTGMQGGAGMLDPMVEARRRRYEEDEAYRRAILAEQAQPRQQGFMENFKDVGLVPLLAGLATGGAAIPMSLAFGLGAASRRGEVQRQTDMAARIAEADERLKMSQAGLEMYDPAILSRGSGVASQTKKVRYSDGNLYWEVFDPNTKQWVPTGKRTEADKTDEGTGVVAAYHAARNNGYIDEDMTLDRFAAEIYKRPGSTQARLDAVTIPEVTRGEEDLNSAAQRGQETEKRMAGLRNDRDLVYMDYLPKAVEAYTAAEDILQKLNDPNFRGNVPLIGGLLASLLPDLGEMQSFSVDAALENLQRTNLAPVTEQEYATIEELSSNPAAWSNAVNVRKMERTLRKIIRHRAWLESKLNYIGRELGEEPGAFPGLDMPPGIPSMPTNPAEAGAAEAGGEDPYAGISDEARRYLTGGQQ